MSTFYRINEFTELAGVTVKALHHYDRLELLRPGRTAAGHRVYSGRDLEFLEQIVALKFLGLPLNQIKVVLDRAEHELPEALRLQREVLEQKQQLLARAIHVIREAERALAPGKPADPAILKRIIEVIVMQDNIDAMKQYYSEEAWLKQRPRYERGASPEWLDLYRDVGSALDEDPAGEKGQKLAQRWLAQVERDNGGDPQLQAGLVKAWADRQNWPTSLRHRITEYNLEAVARFIGKAMAAYRKKYYGEDAWAKLSSRSPEEKDQMSAAWSALIGEVNAALGEDPAGEKGQALAQRWLDQAERYSGGNPEVQKGAIQAWANRKNWPVPPRQTIAAHNLEAIAQFIGDAIVAYRRKNRARRMRMA